MKHKKSSCKMGPFLVWIFLAVSFLASSASAQSQRQLIWKDSVEIAQGSGIRGPWKQNNSNYNYVDDPTVALRESGEVLVAWVDQKQKDILFQKISPKREKEPLAPVNASKSPDTFSWLPRISISSDSNETIYLLWQEIIFSGGSHGGDILFSFSTDRGKSFSEPMNISKSIGGDGKGRINQEVWHNGSLDFVIGSKGSLYAVWTEYDGPLWFRSSVNGGKSFVPAKVVACEKGRRPCRAPSLALGAGGSCYLAWTRGEDPSADIHVARSEKCDGEFSVPVIVEKSKAYSDAPRIVVDSNGILHLVYAESSAGPFEDFHIRYTRSKDKAQSFEPTREISKPSAQAHSTSSFPEIDLDGENNIYVKWELHPGGDHRPVGLAMAFSQDGGKSFSSPQMAPGSVDLKGGANGSHQGLLMKKLDVNSLGQIVLVNSSLKPRHHSRVWLMQGQLKEAPAQ